MGNLRQDANWPFAGPQEVEGNVRRKWLWNGTFCIL